MGEAMTENQTETPNSPGSSNAGMRGALLSLRRAIAWFLARFWGVVIIVAAWQAWVDVKGYNSIVMPHPSGVVMAVINQPGLFAVAGMQTLAIAIIGTVIGMFLGSLSAVLAWWSSVFGGLVTPLAIIFSAVPAVVLVPVIARLLGYDVRTVVAIVAIISFFPSYVFTASGLRSLPPGSEDLFRVYGASRLSRLFFLALPAAIPSWTVALRLGAASAVLSAIIAEFAMGTGGLGDVFRSARNVFDMEQALGASLVATIISVIFFLVAILAERRIRERWT